MNRLRRGAMLSLAPSEPPPVVQMLILGCRPCTAPARWPDAGTPAVSLDALCLISCCHRPSSKMPMCFQGDAFTIHLSGCIMCALQVGAQRLGSNCTCGQAFFARRGMSDQPAMSEDRPLSMGTDLALQGEG